MNIVSCKALLLGATLALAGNSPLLVARNWFDAGVYSAVALGSGILARQSYCYWQKIGNEPMLNSQNMYGFAAICGLTLMCAANSLRNNPEQSKLKPC